MNIFIFFLTLTTIANGQQHLFQNKFFQDIDSTISGYKHDLNVTTSQFLYSRAYDDQLCLQQFTAFLTGLQNTAFWALQSMR